MGKICIVIRLVWDWIKEEIIVYIDFSEVEDICVEVNVVMNMVLEYEIYWWGM